jgi:hypothetical protein
MKRFFYPEIGATIRKAGTMQKGRLIEVSQGKWFNVDFGRKGTEWLRAYDIGCELHDRLKVFRPLVDDEQDFAEWVADRPMWARKLAAFLVCVGVCVVLGIIFKVIVAW